MSGNALNVQEMKPDALIPYARNPRKNRKAIDAVAASLKEFGFQQPIVVDKNMVVIVGHTRLAAAKKLKMETVPVVVAENLSPEQAKAYRLADNSTGELSVWDGPRLELELGELTKLKFDMQPFNFKPVQIDEETGKVIKGDDFENHREHTFQKNMFEYYLGIPENERTAWGFPIIRGEDVLPEHGMTAIHYIRQSEDYESGVHFFTDDYRFENVWSQPEKYVSLLQKFAFVVMPDFSTYWDMPKVMRMWNKWRNHMLAWYWQALGMTVIPNVRFGAPEDQDFIYDGMPHNSTVCISNVGVMQNKEDRSLFMENMGKMIQTIEPSRIIFYGSIPKGYDFKDVEVVSVKSSTFLNQKRGKKGE